MDCDGKSYTNERAHPHLRLIIERDCVPRFFQLLQRGVTIRTRVGCSINVFLSKELEVGPEILGKIQSVFLDGSPVDDLDSAMIKDGSTLALSAAMPGLVGATMRRGGAYSSFRNTITYHENDAQCVSGEGSVQVKLFNLLMAELGPGLLRKGVFVNSSDLREFLDGQPADFWRGCKQVFLDGNPAGNVAQEVNEGLSQYDMVFLSVAY